MDSTLVGISTKRVVFTLTKRKLHNKKIEYFFRMIGKISFEENEKNTEANLNSIIDVLNDKYAVNLSLETETNYTNEILLPFNNVIASLAKSTNSKIVPYFITGDYKFRSENLKIVFGKPLNVSKLSVEKANELLYKEYEK